MLKIDWVTGTTLTEITLLSLAFVLSLAVGMERQRHLKSAGLRTHVLVGLGSSMFTIISGYGFTGLLPDGAILDPSRVAAQIVSGIGFLGAGVIFVRRNAVTGLTTAASIWLVAAIGMACGAGMPVLAIFGTLLHILVLTVLSVLARWVPVSGGGRSITITYRDGRGALRSILQQATDLGFEATLTSTERTLEPAEDGTEKAFVSAQMRFQRGRRPMSELVEELTAIDAVRRIR